MFHNLTLNPYRFEYTDRWVSLVLGFVLIAALIYWKGAPLLRKFLAARAEQISEAYDKSDRYLNEAKQVYNEYTDLLASIEQEHKRHMEEAVREAIKAHNLILDDAHSTAEAITRRMKEEISREQTRQRILLRRQMVQIIISTAEYTFNALRTDAGQHGLIQNFVTLASNQTVDRAS